MMLHKRQSQSMVVLRTMPIHSRAGLSKVLLMSVSPGLTLIFNNHEIKVAYTNLHLI